MAWVRLDHFFLIKSISLEKVKKDSKTFLHYKKLFTKYQISSLIVPRLIDTGKAYVIPSCIVSVSD
jgi:hypothetical protein